MVSLDGVICGPTITGVDIDCPVAVETPPVDDCVPIGAVGNAGLAPATGGADMLKLPLFALSFGLSVTAATELAGTGAVIVVAAGFIPELIAARNSFIAVASAKSGLGGSSVFRACKICISRCSYL